MSIHIAEKSQSATVSGLAKAFADKHLNIRYVPTGNHFWIKYRHGEVPLQALRHGHKDNVGEWVRDERNAVAAMLLEFAHEYAAMHPDVPAHQIVNPQFIRGAIALLKFDQRVAVGQISEVL